MTVQFGREICGDLRLAETREWLVTNGMGGYACGTVAGTLSRHYHGLLVAALKPPLARTLLLTKVDEQVHYGEKTWPLSCDRWADGVIQPQGYRLIEQFRLEGTVPVWTYACGDARLEKRIWMAQGENTTYIRYTLTRASQPFALALKALVNYRDHHSHTQARDWHMQIKAQSHGVEICASAEAVPFYVLADSATVTTAHTWYRQYTLATEQYRGIYPHDDHLHAATFDAELSVGQSLTLVASTSATSHLDGDVALAQQHDHEHSLLGRWRSQTQSAPAPPWLDHLVLAADQCVVARTVDHTPGNTIIAGYPWFGDWGRDTMIALPGLTIATGRPDIARPILRTFARYLSQGMLPNLFPEAGETPGYNTVDAILWYVEAIRQYYDATRDRDLLSDLFPALVDVIDWHQRGTRYQIHLDDDGLIYAGEPGLQLTWMDAKIGDWVVTPRIGKPVEINALWYNALLCMAQFARHLQQPADRYQHLADSTRQGFQRFWCADRGYCYDVLDGPDGHDAALRPNQLLAVALPSPTLSGQPLLSPHQQRAVVDVAARELLTSYGVRSLAPSHPDYQGQYDGSPVQRDSIYHQGPVWGWLMGPFVQAHLQVYRDPELAQSFLAPMADHLYGGCIGTLSEIFDGDAPHHPRGAFAQAWTIAEVLRTYVLTCDRDYP